MVQMVASKLVDDGLEQERVVLPRLARVCALVPRCPERFTRRL